MFHNSFTRIARTTGPRRSLTYHLPPTMKPFHLSSGWFLASEPEEASHGCPVLVFRPTGQVYGPDDIVTPEGHDPQPARRFVAGLVAGLAAGQHEVVKRFVGGGA